MISYFAFRKGKYAGIFDIGIDAKEWKKVFCENNGFQESDVKLFQLSDADKERAFGYMTRTDFSQIEIKDSTKLLFRLTHNGQDAGAKPLGVVIDILKPIAII